MAGQTGQNRNAVTDATRPVSALPEELPRTPGNFAFTQAVMLVLRGLRATAPSATEDNIRYSVNPNLCFPPADIERLEFSEDGARASLMLNLMGLHGAGSPMPAYFTDHVAQNQDYPDALRDFLDIFNHQLIAILYKTWRKYRYYALYESGATDRMSGLFFGFIGVGHADLRRAKALNWPRLMAYMGLIAFKGEAASSLEQILRHYFRHDDVDVLPCMPRWVAIPQDQQCRLGQSNYRLNADFLLGSEVPDQTGKFRIRISTLDWRRFNEFLPCGERFAELHTLVLFVLRSRLEFDVELRLRPEEIRQWKLGKDSECLLGWSVWNGEGGDGIVVLKANRRDL